MTKENFIKLDNYLKARVIKMMLKGQIEIDFNKEKGCENECRRSKTC